MYDLVHGISLKERVGGGVGWEWSTIVAQKEEEEKEEGEKE